MFKVVLGWFGALPIFSKIRFSKHYYFYKLQPKFSKFLLKLLLYLPNDLCQTTLMSFWKFENWKFSVFFFVFTNMGLNGSENFRTLLLLQITAESFQTFPEFSSHILLTFTLFRVVCSCCLLFRLYFSEWLLSSRYCNTFRPPPLVRSSSRELRLDLVSDLEPQSGRGFLAKYTQHVYTLPPDFPELENNTHGK